MTNVNRTLKYFVLLILTAIICFLLCAHDANAVSETGRKNYKLTDGVTESTVYAADSGKKNIVIHILRVQNGANVSLKAGYCNYYKKNSTASSRKKAASKWKAKNWKWGFVTKHVSEYQSIKDKKGAVIAAASMDFIAAKGKPSGKLVMEGNLLSNKSGEDYFAVLKSGSYAIRSGGASTADVEEAVGGGIKSVSKTSRLVSGGKVMSKKGGNREPRQAIGITSDRDVVIVTVDGRDPLSAGITLYDLAMIMKQQGCVEALNMDGGGSAAFLTRRSTDKSVKYRNIHGDGRERNVCSSLLIIKNKKSSQKPITGKSVVSMKNAKTCLAKSSSGIYSYKINGKKQVGIFMINGKNYLFNKKGNGVTKTIKLGQAKYTFKKGLLTKCSDKKAGTVRMGRCGAASDGNNLLFAYHSGNKVLNVGVNPFVKKNGKMRNWKRYEGSLPWYAEKANILRANIGKGVTNIGNYFCYSVPAVGFDGIKSTAPALKKVSISSTVKTIGQYSFYCTSKLKNVTIPANVSKIQKGAFAKSGKGFIKFNRKAPPSFGKSVFSKSSFKTIYVKKTNKWKKFVGKKKFRKLGYKRTVKYR